MKKGVYRLFIGLCVLVSFVGPCFSSELSDDYYDIALNYFCTNNYKKALEYIEDILKLEPENKQALDLKNKILPLENPQLKAKETLETADTLSKTQSPDSFVILDVPQADIEKMDYDSDYYNRKGQEFYQKKEYDMASQYFCKSIKLNSKNAQAYNNLAMCYWFKNNTLLAIKYFKKAFAVNKSYTQPLVNLSLLYKQLGDDKNQYFYLCKAVKHNRNDYYAYYLLGEYHKSHKQFKCAINDYKEVVKINPKYPQVYLSLALCFFETEEFNYCIMALDQYKEFCPSSDYAWFLSARTNLILNRFEDAKKDILKAISICDKPDYEYELAKIAYYQGNYQEALDYFQILLQRTDSAELFNYAGLSSYKLKNLDSAIANFNRAIELDGRRPIYYYNLAQCYKSLGDKKNYVKYVNSATKITPINYQDFIDLSYIYYDNGNPNFAINSLNNAIKCYPNVKALYLAKLKIYEAIGDNLHYNEIKDFINERFNNYEEKIHKK